MATRSTSRPRAAGRPARRSSEMESGSKATVLRITEEAEEDAGLLSYLEARALTPGAAITILSRSESLDSLTLDGPRGRATLGLRPAALIRVLAGRRRSRPVPQGARAAGRLSRRRVPRRPPTIGPCPSTASASRPAPPDPSTSAPRGRPCSTTCSPATPAARSSCGSRTPTSPASTEAFERDILDGLHWLGLAWDEGPAVAGLDETGPYAPYRQMQRLDRYADAAGAAARRGSGLSLLLHARGARRRPQGPGGGEAGPTLRRPLRVAQRRRATRAKAPRAGAAAVRFRVRHGVVGLGRPDPRTGSRSTPTNLGGDFVIVRADGTPLYHFTVVVDDAAMAISHVIRGEDHVSNTPKHLLLFEALGEPIPVFGHLPLILNPDGTKMSKRKSQTAVADYIAQGFVTRGAGQLLRLPRLVAGNGGGGVRLDELERALRHRARPEGRRPLRPRAARVAQRPVDPAARGRRPDRAPAAVPRGRGAPTARSTGSPTRTSCRRSCRSSASGCRPWPRSSTWSASCGSTSSRSTRPWSCPSAGTSRPRPRRSPPPASGSPRMTP